MSALPLCVMAAPLDDPRGHRNLIKPTIHSDIVGRDLAVLTGRDRDGALWTAVLPLAQAVVSGWRLPVEEASWRVRHTGPLARGKRTYAIHDRVRRLAEAHGLEGMPAPEEAING